MKPLYSRRYLYQLSYKEALIPIQRYLYKFENQRKEISRLKLHEKVFLFRAIRTSYKPNGDSIFGLLEKANAQIPIMPTTEFYLFEFNGVKYILWLKYKQLNETKENGFEIRSFYKCIEEHVLIKFTKTPYVSIGK